MVKVLKTDTMSIAMRPDTVPFLPHFPPEQDLPGPISFLRTTISKIRTLSPPHSCESSTDLLAGIDREGKRLERDELSLVGNKKTGGA